MKRVLSLLLVLSVFLTGCTAKGTSQSNAVSENNNATIASSIDASTAETQAEKALPANYVEEEAKNMNFRSMSDPKLLEFMEGAVYSHLVDDLGKDAYIENVSAIYISQEYIDELSYNSKANIFFGYTLKELDEQFQGKSYIFTVEDGKTVVKPRDPYDDTYDKMIRNVAIGTGVILICVTISVVTYGAGAPAASAIFACAAKSGTVMGLSSGTISGVATGITTGLNTGDWEKAKKAGFLAGTESFKFSAIAGTILGGAGEAIGLHGATLNGLSMDEAATIQRESKLPLKLIKEFKSMDQYNIVKNSGLYGGVVDGKPAIIRNIKLDFKDEMGRTNLERMKQGLAAIDPESGLAYELHHMGQTPDATMAILTQAEHRGVGNHAIWHDLISKSQVDHGAQWIAQKEAFWKSLATILAK